MCSAVFSCFNYQAVYDLQQKIVCNYASDYLDPNSHVTFYTKMFLNYLAVYDVHMPNFALVSQNYNVSKSDTHAK